MIKRAIIHVENITGLIPFSKFLVDSGWTLCSANKTEEFLRENGIPVERESALVENSHFLTDTTALIRQILNTKYVEEEEEQSAEKNNCNVFLVCMNVKPFFEKKMTGEKYKKISKPFSFYISTLIRNSFVNHENILILTDPEDYDEAMIQIKTKNITPQFRTYLAAKALNLVSAYDSGIANSVLMDPKWNNEFTKYLTFPFIKQSELKSGANINQKASVYRIPDDTGAVSSLNEIQKDELDYNTVCDVCNAWEIISSVYENLKNQYTVKSVNADGYNFTTQFTPLTGTVFTIAIKFKTILGAALSTNIKESFEKTYNFNTDKISDVIIGCSAVVDENAASEMIKYELKAIVAPDFTEKAKEILSANNKIKLIPTAKITSSKYDLQLVNGGLLFQMRDSVIFDQWYIKTKNRPSQQFTDEMAFGMMLAMNSKTYSAVLVKDNAVVGISQSCKYAEKAVSLAYEEAKELAKKDKKVADVLICDTELKLCDSIKELIKNGLSAIIQTGCTQDDKEFIEYCNEHNVVMVYTLMSHISY